MKNRRKSIIIVILVGSIVLLWKMNFDFNNTIATQNIKIGNIEIENEGLYEQLAESNSKLAKLKQETKEKEILQSEYSFYDIPLSHEIQIYIQNLCKKHNIDYKIVISLLQLESNFQTDLISETSDLGISQINTRYIYWYADIAGLENYDPFDIYDSVAMCVAGLAYYRDYWISKGITGEETLMIYTLNTYNMGYNYKNYIEKTGTIHRNYSNLILGYKKQLEINGYF